MKSLPLDRRILAGAAVLLVAAVLVAASPSRHGTEPAPASEDAAPLLVTSSLGSTSAVLFVLDPEARTLAAYEAVPGSEGGLSLLGARKIEHDLRLTQYRDQSEFSHAELRERYLQGSGDEDDRD